MAKKKASRRTPLDRGMAHARREMARGDRRDERYMILCNLIETIWANRLGKDFWKVDYTDLLQATSPQAREIATFIESLYDEECQAHHMMQYVEGGE